MMRSSMSIASSWKRGLTKPFDMSGECGWSRSGWQRLSCSGSGMSFLHRRARRGWTQSSAFSMFFLILWARSSGSQLWACYLTCAVCVIPFLLVYFLQYRRAVEHIRQEQVLAILSGFEREIADLRKQVSRAM